MGYVRQIELPAIEPISLAQARAFLQLPASYTLQDTVISQLISAAREYGEDLTGRALAQRRFAQALDSFPYYADTIQGQQAYPPSYYSLPRYSTTLWNYSQMIKLYYPPAISVEEIRYVKPDGALAILHQDVDFVLDREAEPARLFPVPGQYWPPCLYVPNAVEIRFTAGYDPDPAAIDTHAVVESPPKQQPSSIVVSGIPNKILMLLCNLVFHWFQNRGDIGRAPDAIDKALRGMSVQDWCPTRG